ncbi:MAG: (cytosine-5)-methyltransferase 1 [Candidatus Sumerlaeota bacterium]|nr:(cytosine-5)-methyltransferase 1 [Candidatus Sumerlaeota bacterium]
MTELTCVELCAGAGGQALGLEAAGFEHLALVDINNWCVATLRQNRPGWHVYERDVRDVARDPYFLGSPDLLAAGLPCPPFSVAGKQLGVADERNLFPAAFEIIEKLQPNAVMIENVRGFLDPVFADYRDEIRRNFRKLGYEVDWRLLNASDFGVPQLRPRVAIVALKKSFWPTFAWPEPISVCTPTVGEVLYDLMAENGWKHAARWKQKACAIAPTIVGGSTKHGGPDLGPTRAKKAWAEMGVNGKLLAEKAPEKDFEGDPCLTVRMVARLQGFPDSWQFSGRKTAQYRQVGNAFPPPVAQAVASAIRECLAAENVEREAV